MLLAVALLVGACWGATVWWRGHGKAGTPAYAPRPRGQVTFNKDIAPIVFQHCAPCHRPGQAAPFALLSFQDVKKHAADMADATVRRFMPPWLPEAGFGDFAEERRLSAEQIGLIQQWVAEGGVEGEAADRPPVPTFSGEWQLGRPDLILTMTEPFPLAAEGRDVYRNFVIPAALTRSRYVRGVEFHPGNPKIVHHAFVKLDRTARSRRQDADDPGPGFGGMNVAAEMPGGHFLGWQPGRVASWLPEGLPWRMDPGNDLVLQVHLNTTGRPEQLQSSVGLYFTDQPPTNTCFKMCLNSFVMDIPAGTREYVVEDRFVLPVAAQVLAVLPHAHYLAREMRGWAMLPDGTRRELLWIKQWDFNWQGDYRCAQPVALPAGSTLAMRFTYDNSAENVRNPNQPPKPVAYGAQSSDEMAELWFQLLPANERDHATLARAYEETMNRKFMAADEHLLRKNPADFATHGRLAVSLIGWNRLAEAEQHLRAALALQPEYAPTHYNFGLLFRRLNKPAEARIAFETALRLAPGDFKAHSNLGFVLLLLGDAEAARANFETALRLNPDDEIARDGLSQSLRALGRIQ